LGQPGCLKPFVGRKNEIATLNEWATDPHRAPNLFLTALAGRGKTSLLVHWLAQASKDLQKVFLPISIRYGTDTASIFYQALATQLNELANGGRLFSPPSDPAEYFKEQCLEALEILRQRKLGFVMIIDGLDEATGWEFDSTLFSSSVPQQKMIISARELVGEHSTKHWLYRLGWHIPGTAEVLQLDRLTKADIKEVVRNVFILSQTDLSAEELDDELARLSDGDPLILEYLIDDLRSVDRSHHPLSARELAGISAGFPGYFANWLERQRPIWVSTSVSTERTLTAILAALTCALGPISNREISVVIQRAFGIQEPITKQTLKPIERFVVGDGEEGYILAHPMLSNYFRDDFFHKGRAISDVEAAFVGWAIETLSKVNSGRVAHEAPPYLIRHAAQHLIAAGASGTDLISLAQNGWRQTCRAMTGDEQAFANGLQVALNYFIKICPDRGAEFPAFAAVVRCALGLSSIASLGYRTPVEVLVSAAVAGVISTKKALEIAKFQGPAEFIEMLAALAPILLGETKDTELTLALKTIPHMPGVTDRVKAYVSLSKVFDGDLLEDAEKVDLEKTADEFDRALGLAALAGSTEGPKREKIVLEALAAIRAIQGGIANPELLQVQALTAIAPYLSQGRVADALEITRNMSDYHRFDATLALASHLSLHDFLREMATFLPTSETDRQIALEPIELANAIGESRQGSFIAAIADKVTHAQVKALCEVALRLSNDWQELTALLGLIPTLNELERNVAVAEVVRLATTQRITISSQRTLQRLLPYLSRAQQEELFVAAKARLDPVTQSAAIADLAPTLTPAQISVALQSLESIDDDGSIGVRVAKLAEIVPHLPDEEAERCLEGLFASLGEIRDSQSSLAHALANIASFLPKSRLKDALTRALTIRDNLYRVVALTGISRFLSGQDRDRALSEALTAAKNSIETSEHGIQLGGLAGLAGLLSEAQLIEIYEVVKNIEYGPYRIEGFSLLVPHLPPLLIEEMLARVKSLEDNGEKLDGFLGLLPRLPEVDAAAATSAAIHLIKEVNVDLFFDDRLKCMSSEHFGRLAWQFKRVSGSSGFKVQAAIAC
jgi:hypothetical protein